MKKSVYIYGPAGCGKTNHAEKLLKHFGLKRVIDDWSNNCGMSLEVRSDGDLVLGQRLSDAPPGMTAIAYSSVARFVAH